MTTIEIPVKNLKDIKHVGTILDGYDVQVEYPEIPEEIEEEDSFVVSISGSEEDLTTILSDFEIAEASGFQDYEELEEDDEEQKPLEKTIGYTEKIQVKPRATQYVNNKTLYKRICEWKASGEKKIPDDIAIMIKKICEGLGRSGKFCGYTWLPDMIGDAIYTCIRFCGNFNPERSENVFAYFTQIAHHAFIKRISMEKNRLAALHEMRENTLIIYNINSEIDDDGNYHYIDDKARNINRTYVKKKADKKNNKKRNIEDLI